MPAAVPLTRDEIITLLLEALGPHLELTERILSFAHGVADAVGGETLTVFTHLLAEHHHVARRVRIYHQALATPPTTAAGDADGN